MTLDECTAHITDPRRDKNKKYALSSLLLIIFSSTISGYDTPEAMVEFAKLKHEWLQRFVTLDSIPCVETLRFFICSINTEELIKGFEAFIQEAGEGDIISIDGKTMRGIRHSALDTIHMVSAWSKKHGVTLTALKTKDKSNEIKTIPLVLDLIDINGAIVTTDAMGCQVKVADKIRSGGGDYVLQLKDNQKALRAEIEAYYHKLIREDFANITHDTYEEVDKGHGRIEQRKTHHVEISDWVNSARKWCDANSLIRVERNTIKGEKESSEVSWYLSSLAVDAQRGADAVRSHWGVENNLHWQLDVTFKEDECRLASGAAAMAVIKRFCMNLLKVNDTSKRRLKHRVMASAIDDDYRAKILLSV